jgi:hypothetical protein
VTITKYNAMVKAICRATQNADGSTQEVKLNLTTAKQVDYGEIGRAYILITSPNKTQSLIRWELDDDKFYVYFASRYSTWAEL